MHKDEKAVYHQRKDSEINENVHNWRAESTIENYACEFRICCEVDEQLQELEEQDVRIERLGNRRKCEKNGGLGEIGRLG